MVSRCCFNGPMETCINMMTPRCLRSNKLVTSKTRHSAGARNVTVRLDTLQGQIDARSRNGLNEIRRRRC